MITNKENTRIVSERISFAAAIVVLSFGFIVIAGWVFDMGVLKSLHPGFVSMKANTAISFLLLGVGSLFIIHPPLTNSILKNPKRKYLLASMLSVFVGLISALTIIQYLLNINLGIDEMLFKDDTSGVSTYLPGRMALHTAFGFLFLSAALLIYSLRKEFAFVSAQLLSLFVLLLSVLPLLGYFYRIEGLVGFGGYTQMALHTALLFFISSLSLLFSKPDHGLLSIVSSTGTGGYFARRLLPIATLIPVVLIWLRIMIGTQSISFLPSEISYFFILLIIIFVWFVWKIAISLNKLDQEREQTEKKLQQSSNQLELILEHAGNGIFAVNKGGITFMVNKTTLSLLGYNIEEFIGKNVHDILQHHLHNGMTYPAGECDVYKTYTQGKPANIDDEAFMRKDGSSIPVDYTSTPIFENDKVTGAVISFRDISDRKKAEQEIHHKNAFIQKVLDNLPIGIALNKFDEGELTYMNKKFEEFYGWEKDTMKDLNAFFANVYPDQGYREKIMNRVMTDIQSGNPNRMQWENIMVTAQDGTKRYINAYNIPFVDQNTMVSTVIDVTKQKLYEQQIKSLNEELEHKIEQRTLALQQANKELEAFTYSVSHDLRAPLRAIDGFTRILQEDYDGILDDDGRRVTGVIRENTLKMGKLIDDLLSFSRLSRKEIVHSEIDMGTLAHSIYYELTTEKDRNRWNFTVGNLPRAYGDPTMIRQVWVNLISNALKFSAPKEKPEINIFATDEGEYIKFSIQDNGVGFDMRYVDKIFGVFQRLHSAREFEGTGLGLAIVQRVIEKHEGMVSASSKLEEYSLFDFSLPVQLK